MKMTKVYHSVDKAAMPVVSTYKKAELQFVWQTSWGMSTHMVGKIIMTHGDDIGLLPPRVAPIQVVIFPIWRKDERKGSVMAAALQVGLKKTDVCVKLDATEKKTPGWKFNFWEMEGVPSKIKLVMDVGLLVLYGVPVLRSGVGDGV
ncbi:unnamed protein product [Sphagnum balticum]